MWSLTSQRERRTSGPENFQSQAKKDFFNTICQLQKLRLAGNDALHHRVPDYLWQQ